MELFLILAVIMAAAAANTHTAHLTKEQSAKVLEYSMECIKQSGVSLDVVAQARQGHYKDDEGLKKFTLCFFQKTGILTSDGKLNEDVAMSKLPAEIDRVALKKVLDECKTKTGKDAADTAFEIFKCYHKNTPMHVSF